MCVDLHSDFSGGWVADVEVDLCTEGGVESVLNNRSLHLLTATLDNAVWVSPWRVRGEKNEQSLKCIHVISTNVVMSLYIHMQHLHACMLITMHSSWPGQEHSCPA